MVGSTLVHARTLTKGLGQVLHHQIVQILDFCVIGLQCSSCPGSLFGSRCSCLGLVICTEKLGVMRHLARQYKCGVTLVLLLVFLPIHWLVLHGWVPFNLILVLWISNCFWLVH